MKKRLLSMFLVLVMLFTMVPFSAFAKDDHDDFGSDFDEDDWTSQSTITFEIVNGTWKDVTNTAFTDFTLKDSNHKAVVTTYSKEGMSGYVYKCGGYMETMLSYVLGGNLTNYIQPDDGYTVTGTEWIVVKGGLQNDNSTTGTAEMQKIYGTNGSSIHSYDTHGGASDTFAADTIYRLILIKANYSVTGNIDNGTVNDADSYSKTDFTYKQTSPALVFEADTGYYITSVKVNSTAVTNLAAGATTYTYRGR